MHSYLISGSSIRKLNSFGRNWNRADCITLMKLGLKKNRVDHDLLNYYNIMIFLQKNIWLDGDYNNHSISTNVISKLDFTGFEAQQIITLSSHKYESTVKEYSVNMSSNKRFESLSNAMQPKFYKINQSPTPTQYWPLILLIKALSMTKA